MHVGGVALARGTLDLDKVQVGVWLRFPVGQAEPPTLVVCGGYVLTRYRLCQTEQAALLGAQ